MMRSIRWLTGTVLLLALLLVSNLATAGATRSGMVRVQLASLGLPQTITVTAKGNYSINNTKLSDGRQVIFNLSSGAVQATVNGSTFGPSSSLNLTRNDTTANCGLVLQTQNTAGSLYPGDITVSVATQDGVTGLQVVLLIYMQDYLKGVLPW